jgi:hypothetical protein
MTARELLRLVLRRWYIMLFGAAIGVAVIWLTLHRPGVYWTEFNVVLLAPTYEEYPNKLEDAHYPLAPMAGLVASEWNGENRPLRMASSYTTLFGEGQRHGSAVRVPNQGSQWQPFYNSPNINVQVVDNDPTKVASEAAHISAQVNTLLEQRQDALGVRPTMRMTTMEAPTNPTIFYISGSRVRVMLAVSLVSTSLSTVAIYWIERLLVLRRSTGPGTELAGHALWRPPVRRSSA